MKYEYVLIVEYHRKELLSRDAIDKKIMRWDACITGIQAKWRILLLWEWISSENVPSYNNNESGSEVRVLRFNISIYRRHTSHQNIYFSYLLLDGWVYGVTFDIYFAKLSTVVTKNNSQYKNWLYRFCHKFAILLCSNLSLYFYVWVIIL